MSAPKNLKIFLIATLCIRTYIWLFSDYINPGESMSAWAGWVGFYYRRQHTTQCVDPTGQGLLVTHTHSSYYCRWSSLSAPAAYITVSLKTNICPPLLSSHGFMTGQIHGEVTLFGVLASGSINIYNLLLPDPHMLIILPAQQFRSGEHQLKHSTHNVAKHILLNFFKIGRFWHVLEIFNHKLLNHSTHISQGGGEPAKASMGWLSKLLKNRFWKPLETAEVPQKPKQVKNNN